MKKYKLIKEYPGSAEVGSIASSESKTDLWKGTSYYDKYPEYWEEVIENDYEIIRYYSKENVTIGRTTSNVKINDTYKIYSVKRLSDGEVFTVGDLIKTPYTDCTPIIGFDTKYSTEYFIEVSTGFTRLLNLEKVKQPIFLTHDGKNIFPEDIVWYVNKENLYYDCIKAHPQVKFYSNINAYFLTRQQAKEYVAKNKIIFTTEDGVGIKKGDNVYIVSAEGELLDYIYDNIQTDGRVFSRKYFSTKQAAEDYVAKNKVLFTTQDGVGIKKGDTYYFVDTNLKISLAPNASTGAGLYDERKYFSTYETALYYVIVNAKVLSIEEFWGFVSKPGSNVVKQKALKRLVKQRLKIK